ncbi:hypothetical protein RHMOL_Rhmol09G0089000 [Rhododendron molle]|uniref:Uncharacterized protein n=1 Tax=Rhododendron molle TaxID=49168 RepID=A0ACC0MCI4_RHOML|nr:hypothetical protein RHMOL_Rhmol09G0089000 [Rhododendron molle]
MATTPPVSAPPPATPPPVLAPPPATPPPAIPPLAPVLEINHQGSTEPSNPKVFTKDFGDFEFRLEDPVTMLPTDEKPMPLHLSMIPSPATTEISSPETMKSHRRSDVSSMPDPYLFSPKAPRCSSQWRLKADEWRRSRGVG